MELGALICLPRQPRCEVCPVARHCFALRTGRVEMLPAKRPGAKSSFRRVLALVVERQGRLLLRQRIAGEVNALFWELPNVEMGSSPTNSKTTALPVSEDQFETLFTLRHVITRYRIEITVARWRARKVANPSGQIERWVNRPQLARLAVTSAHRKILRRLGWL